MKRLRAIIGQLLVATTLLTNVGLAQTGVTVYQVSHTYVSVGTFTATVTATDLAGNFNSASAIETINNFVGVNSPDVELSLDPSPSAPGATLGNPPLTVTATVTTTAGCTTTIAVNWGDGTTTIGTSSSHTYTTGGLYTVMASVTDCLNNTGIAINSFVIGQVPAINSIQLILPTQNPNTSTNVYTPIRIYALITSATTLIGVTVAVDGVIKWTATGPNAAAGTVYTLDQYDGEAVGTTHIITVTGTMTDGSTVTATVQVKVMGVIN